MSTLVQENEMKEMEDNYLWDRSGEADPEIQELEEILGTLRYQPRPLQIPAQFPMIHRRDFRSWLAVAAALALVAIGLSLWFSFNRRQVAAPLEAKNEVPIERTSVPRLPPSTVPDQGPAPATTGTTGTPRRRHETLHNLTARTANRAPRATTREPELTPQELADKEQVLVALRLISFKLNLAQRKAQGAPSLSPIRNQHRSDRIG